MKKFLFATLFVASLGVINAQQLPNLDFENWSGDKPSEWNGLSVEVPILGTLDIGTNSLSKSSDAYSGSSALKIAVSDWNPLLQAVLADSLSAILEYPVPGLATNATIDFMTLLPVFSQFINGEMDPALVFLLADALKDGTPITQKPVALFGAGKANKVNENDMLIAVGLVYAQVTTDTGVARQLIGYGMSPIQETYYEGFCIDINYDNPTATPSEFVVLFVVAATEETTAPYSSMLIDYLNISYGAGINNAKLSDVSIYPNPAKDVLNIKTSATKYEIEVIDMLGRVVITENSKPTINISDLTKGVYFVKVTQNGTTNTEKIVVE